MSDTLFIGLMSGTSIDAIDCALVHCDGSAIHLLHTHSQPFPEGVREQIELLSQPGENEIERLGAMDRELGMVFARAVDQLLVGAGRTAADVTAIGSHGQTIRHHPPSAKRNVPTGSFTLQIGDPNTIAEQTGITTVADFRRRDIAAGGEGAPLAPAFHRAAFAREGVNRAIVNIGGMANVTQLQGESLVRGYDTGPGNTLLDYWHSQHREGAYDRDGAWAAGGVTNRQLLDRCLDHPYFALSGPRSTGKEAFNPTWLDSVMSGLHIDARDVQSTLAELTAVTIANSIDTEDFTADEVYVCGGGAHNRDLLQRLQRLLTSRPVASTESIGMGPDWVEAAAFGWLAYQTISRLPGNAPCVTGAAAPRILGGIYPA